MSVISRSPQPRFLATWRAPFAAEASAAGVLVFSDSMLILLFSFCRKLVAVVTSHHSSWEKWQAESLAIK
jgi:hypothetical protein